MAKDLTGTMLGKYQIMERLGRGGMADVYRAYQVGMDRYVAVKIMHGHLATDPDFVTRFQREARTVGTLRHPNIVQVIDFDVQDDEYYMVMEFIQGDTLKALLQRQGALPVREVLDIAAKLADALAYAHSRGMVHRDIKPANILFTQDREPVITDFGIARIMDASGLTQSGMAIGTPSYMSPEAGRGEKVDERADIYSLGIVLYEMLTGHVPYDADTPYAVILKHINDPLPLPRQFNAALPDSVERVVLRALVKNPEDRFQTAADLRDTIQQAKTEVANQNPTQTGKSANTKMTTGPEEKTVIDSLPLSKPAPNILPLVAAGVVVLLVIVGVLAVISNNVKPTPNAIAVLPSNTPSAAVSSTAALVVQPSASTTTQPSTIPIAIATQPATPDATQSAVLVVTLPATSPAPQSADNSKYANLISQAQQMIIDGDRTVVLQLIQDALKTDPQSYDLLAMRSRIYLENNELDKSKADADTALAIDPKRPEANIMQALYLRFKTSSTNDERTANLKKALIHLDTAIAYGTKDYYAYWQRALVAADYNGYVGTDNGVPDANIVKDLDTAAALALKDPRVHMDRGRFYFDRGNYAEAQKSYARAIIINPTGWDAYEYLATCYMAQGQTQKAYDLYLDAVETKANHDSKFLADAAYVARAIKNNSKAKEWADLALLLQPDTPAATYLLALLDQDEGHYQQALDKLDQVLKIESHDRYDYPFFNPLFDHSLQLDRARVLAQLKQLDNAVAAYDLARKDQQYWLTPIIEQAQVYSSQGKKDEALTNLRLALGYALDQKNTNAQSKIIDLIKQLGGEATEQATNPS